MHTSVNSKMWHFLYKVLLVIGLTILIVVSWGISCYGYEAIIDNLLGVLGETDNIQSFKQEVLTVNRFSTLKTGWILITIVYTLFFIRLWKNTHHWALFTSYLFKKSRNKIGEFFNELHSDKKWEVAIFYTFLIGLIIYRIWLCVQMPLMEDEASSYVYFVKKGFFTTISYYPAPNNHVFYNILCWLVSLFTSNPNVVMKLPVLIISVLTSIAVFVIAKNHFGFLIAFVACILFSFSYNINLYAVTGRGYMLQNFLMLISLYSMIQMLREVDLSFYSFVFVLCSALGFYTIPSYIYIFLPMIVFGFNFGLLMRGLNVKWIIKNSFWALVLTLVLYLPIIAFNGISALLTNGFIPREDSYFSFIVKLPTYFTKVSNWLWDVPQYGIFISLLVFIISSIVLFKVIQKNKYFWTYLIISISLMPLLVLFFQKVYPFERVWNYFTFYQYLFVAIAIVGVLKAFISNNKVVFAISIILSLSLSTFFVFRFEKDRKSSLNIYEHIREEVVDVFEEQPGIIFCENSTYYIYIEMYLQKTPHKVRLTNQPIAKEEKQKVVYILNKKIKHEDKNLELIFENNFIEVMK